MMNKNQQNQSTDEQDLNRELISTVTATVLQTLKETGQTSGESKEYKNSKTASKTVDLVGMLFHILERAWIEVDFTGFEAIIDRVGGIDIELTSAEAAYINKRNHTSIVAGLNHLNGAEALTYARARKIDNDFGRTERQRKVLSAMYEQAKNLSVTELLGLMYNVRSYLTTDLTDSEILSLIYRLLPLASSISINSYTVPADDCYYYASIRGMSVLVPDLPRIRQCLEEYLPLE